MDSQENTPAAACFLSSWAKVPPSPLEPSLPWVWRSEEDGKNTGFMLEEEIPLANRVTTFSEEIRVRGSLQFQHSWSSVFRCTNLNARKRNSPRSWFLGREGRLSRAWERVHILVFFPLLPASAAPHPGLCLTVAEVRRMFIRPNPSTQLWQGVLMMLPWTADRKMGICHF